MITVTPSWRARPTSRSPEIDAAFCDLTIALNDTPITRVCPPDSSPVDMDAVPEPRDSIRVSVYPLAEWMAENYWCLLHEPRKDDPSSRDHAYRRRHRFVAGRGGFALPDVVIDPEGESVRVSATPFEYPSAGLIFPVRAHVTVGVEALRETMDRFLGQVATRLHDCGVTDTVVQRLFDAIRTTAPEQEQVCQLLGAMGLNPYRADDAILSALDRASDDLSDTVLRDLCLAVHDQDFVALHERVGALRDEMETEGHTIDLTGLGPFRLQPDGPSDPVWMRGRRVAEALRDHLSLRHDALDSGKRLFDRLGLDRILGGGCRAGATEHPHSPVRAALQRRGDQGAMAVVPAEHPESRRFDGMRGAYLALTPVAGHGALDRLVTTARTVDQKASRAFAAEILVPYRYLEKKFSDRIASVDELDDIALDAGVSSYVVHHQAQNNRIEVVG